jgi:chemotaxis protein methyltransferase CheR
MTTAPQDAGFAFFARKVEEVLAIDLAGYRPEQMLRRLEQFRLRHGAASFYALGRRLAADPAFAAELKAYLTIQVTEFFRNPEHFAHLARRVLPELPPVGRWWSAGCSIGAEAYSLGMLALEADRPATRILATDIDPEALARTRAGVYREAELAGVSPQRRARFFTPAPGGGFAVRPELRRLVQVQRHDLLRDPLPGPWDLILCRNVVIYFTAEARQALYRRFRDALRPGGFLFVGGTESVAGSGELGLEMVAPFFYRRVA